MMSPMHPWLGMTISKPLRDLITSITLIGAVELQSKQLFG